MSWYSCLAGSDLSQRTAVIGADCTRPGNSKQFWWIRSLKINVKKRKFFIFKSSFNLVKSSLAVGDDKISPSSTAKNLINCHLKLDKYISATCRTFFFHIVSQLLLEQEQNISSFERAENFGGAGLFGKTATTDEGVGFPPPGGKFLCILTVSTDQHACLVEY